MINIARFNWPFYVAAILVLCAALAGLFLLSVLPLKLLCGLVFALAAWFLIGSLGVSHLIYDRSDLYRWGWLDRALRGSNMSQAIVCHSGFDEASAELHQKFSASKWQVLDHFDANKMTEASIRRARAMFPPLPGTVPSRYDAWPVAAGSVDVVFGLLAIHELRSESERNAWFAESGRCLRKGGRLVLVEHVRDAANFFAFGPGFLHFHSPASWRRCWESVGLLSIDEFRVTPFVRVFILDAP
ncbi:MAG TPA: class I SAM-dependent methyltransferase [Verrucomicrobiae bacterium]|jgi:SAM-dependent methyltransferase|nr:class I SAM-dependent methyltransferase [Verrucomicrobiae bacterium]